MALSEYHLKKAAIKRITSTETKFIRIAAFVVYTYLLYLYTNYVYTSRDKTEESTIQVYFHYMQSVIGGPMIIVNLIYFGLYYFNFPWLEQYRLNDMPWPWESDPDQWRNSLWKVLRVYCVNQIMIFPVCFYLLTLYFSPDLSVEKIPDFLTFLWQSILSIFLEDFFFYWNHRLMHLPFLYKRVHKIHHEFKNTIHIASVYTHWLEFILGNFVPMMASLIMLGDKMHVTTLTGYILIRVIGTYAGHSGFEFPWMPTLDILSAGCAFHNYHHLKNMGNYGSHSWVWDYLFRTSEGYYKEAGLENCE